VYQKGIFRNNNFDGTADHKAPSNQTSDSEKEAEKKVRQRNK